MELGQDMTPRVFEYYAPTSVKEAVSFLSRNEDAKVLAGGQSLLALMKLRLASPKYLVDITGLSKELSYIKEIASGVAIGALTTHDTLENSNLIRSNYACLVDAASRIGDQQIRNAGTIGGSVCHADPAADLLPSMLILEAKMVVVGPKSERKIEAKDFFVDFFTTSLKPNEVLREIQIPALPSKTSTAYIKHSRREGDFAIVGTACLVTLDNNGNFKNVRIALGSVAPTPIRAAKAEQNLMGKRAEISVIREAAEMATEGISPPSDMHGSAQYRTEMVKVFVRRTLELALSRLKTTNPSGAG
jgi:CO/xanthine dehydrogenase FAD-binding subunit